MSSPPTQTLIEDFLMTVLQSSMEDRKKLVIHLRSTWMTNRIQYFPVLFRISLIGQNYEIFLDPEPDWMSFLLKSDPDYPKRFEHLFFSCENFIDNLRVLMLDDVVYIVL